MRFPGFIIVLMILSSSVIAQKRNYSVGIYYDQDYTLEMIGLKSLNEDRNYTMGLGFSFSHPTLKRFFLFEPLYLVNRVFQKKFLNDRENLQGNISNSLMIANGSFTPDSLAADYVINNDRPYGSLTYLQFQTSLVDNVKLKKYSTFLNLGFLGTNLSENIQTAIHKAMNDGDTKNPRTPRGWDYQISDPGEFTFSYASATEKLLTRKNFDSSRTNIWAGEAKQTVQYSIGSYTYVGYGLTFRFGKIDPRNWTYIVDPLFSSNKLAGSYYDKKKHSEIYAFASARSVLMMYNALLNGQLRESAQVLSFSEMKHLIGEFDLGISYVPVFNQNSALRIVLKISGRSPEFKLAGRPPRWHYWGGIDLTFSRF